MHPGTLASDSVLFITTLYCPPQFSPISFMIWFCIGRGFSCCPPEGFSLLRRANLWGSVSMACFSCVRPWLIGACVICSSKSGHVCLRGWRCCVGLWEGGYQCHQRVSQELGGGLGSSALALDTPALERFAPIGLCSRAELRSITRYKTS